MDEFTTKRLEALLRGYIAAKIPSSMRTAVRLAYRIEEDRVTLTEERPEPPRYVWTGTELAQFRLEQGTWSLYAKSADGCWSAAESLASQPDFEDQLAQLEQDPEGLFWK